MNVVWILGAGFSCPLGGPLLNDLFSPVLQHKLEAQLPSLAHELAPIHDVYGFHELQEPVRKWNLPWRHAEEFLEYVDIARRDGNEASAEHIRKLLWDRKPNGAPTEGYYQWLARQSKRYFAAVCSGFVPGRNEVRDEERWEPYRHWAAHLSSNDTVITFNYDQVAETVCPKLGVPLPDHVESLDEDDGPLLLKLHGSVDWHDDGRGAVTEINRPVMEALEDPQWEPAIVGPGPQKREMIQNWFSDLWSVAQKRIRSADVLVFVGYRFPETDAFAKRRLLTSVRDGDSHEGVVRTVLGPERDRDVIRLEGMMRWALRKRAGPRGVILGDKEARELFNERQLRRPTIIPEPMWAEDYLAVFDRNMLGTPGSEVKTDE
jgi:hypothetical protein